MADSVLREKSKLFAKEVIFLCRKLKQNGVEMALVNQLLRAGTSVGANIHEAQYAQGTKDFISKLEIALKECNESEYWLGLLFEVNSISKEDFENFQKECIEIRRMLVSSVTTLKKKDRMRESALRRIFGFTFEKFLLLCKVKYYRNRQKCKI